MNHVYELLQNAGLDSAHYHQESFATTPKEAPNEPISQLPPPVEGEEEIHAGENLTVRFAYRVRQSCKQRAVLVCAFRQLVNRVCVAHAER